LRFRKKREQSEPEKSALANKPTMFDRLYGVGGAYESRGGDAKRSWELAGADKRIARKEQELSALAHLEQSVNWPTVLKVVGALLTAFGILMIIFELMRITK